MIENQYGFRGGIGTDDMRFEDLDLDPRAVESNIQWNPNIQIQKDDPRKWTATSLSLTSCCCVCVIFPLGIALACRELQTEYDATTQEEWTYCGAIRVVSLP